MEYKGCKANKMDNTKKLFKYKEISKAIIVQTYNMTIWIDNGLGVDEL
ncbi:MAG: hypothetical protein IJH61_01885 [Eubacteriaceae bacterium]|nr:hypothetical protein [Eubacteriaceae bacterium]